MIAMMNGSPYPGRIGKLRQLLEQVQADAVIVTSAANLFYFTGVWIEAHERLTALVVRRKEDAFLIAPDLHRGELGSLGMETLFWRDGVDASALLAGGIAHAGVVGIDDSWPSGHLLRLMSHRPRVNWRSGTEMTGRLRMVKDRGELELIRKSAAVANRVMESFQTYLRVGSSEEKLLDELQELWRREGIRELSFNPTVASGANGANPHHAPGTVVVREGDFVIVDTGGKLDRYCSDMTRTFAVGGEPSAEQRDVYELVKEAHLAGLRAVRPGVTLSEIDRTVRAVIEEGGYGPYFIHRTGHGLGIDVHEEPSVQTGNGLPVEAGMVFSIEPGIYLPGKFGVRIEDIVIVTDDGGESVNASVSKELTVV
ncbi:M24 family metallopeptidase [Paenibacillus sp. GCM10012303]|uniref:M24 family metallopeptidase n=1 Tax=Paenibacillus sp. GCM10012303 TaxID=3317340 RepID=UPI00361B5DD2